MQWLQFADMSGCLKLLLCDTGKMTDSIAVTSAGNLPSRYIIHLATPTTYEWIRPAPKDWEERVIHLSTPTYEWIRPASKDWVERIIKSLEKTESLKMNSITFPLLGTGITLGPNSHVNILLFHRHMRPLFLPM